MFRMSNRLSYLTLALLLFAAPASAQTNVTAKAGNAPAVNAPVETDRSRDGLIGPVRRIRTEIAKLVMTDGRQGEAKHVLVELAAYDIKGNKIENQYFPIAGGATLTGKEVYKYDEKGNISEMTLLNPDGSLLSKETYKYEFDFLGNWNKMTTSVAVVDARGITFEPTEVTYRSIMYYLDENMLKTMSGTPAAAPQPAPPANANTAANTTAPPVTAPPVTKPAEPKAKSDPKSNAGNKSRDNRKPTLAPDLPEASASATQMIANPNDVRTPTAPVMTNQEVRISLEEPPPAPRPILKPVSGGVLNGTALSLPQPIYPEAAKRTRTAGLVSVEVILDETGKVISATAMSGPTLLREAAVQAAMRAKFSPTKLSGQPVKVSGTINYKFALVP